MSFLDRILSFFRTNKAADKPNHKGTSQIQAQSQHGQVIHKKELGTIEAAGVKLHASLEVRKFTEEETRANTKENRWYFEPAFWKVASGIVADKAALETLLPELLVAHTAGDPHREQETVIRYLPEGSWRWPAYENYVGQMNEQRYKESLEKINSSTISDLLNNLTIQELKNIFNYHCQENTKSPGKKKSEIIAAIISILDENTSTELADKLRSRFREELDEPGAVNFREMCSMFAEKVTHLAYSIRRRKQMLENVDDRPYWQYESQLYGKCSRKNHVVLHNKVFRYDDPFWDSFWPPLDWDCACYVKALREKDLIREGLKVESSEGRLHTEDRLVSATTSEIGPVTVYTNPETGDTVASSISWRQVSLSH